MTAFRGDSFVRLYFIFRLCTWIFFLLGVCLMQIMQTGKQTGCVFCPRSGGWKGMGRAPQSELEPWTWAGPYPQTEVNAGGLWSH